MKSSKGVMKSSKSAAPPIQKGPLFLLLLSCVTIFVVWQLFTQQPTSLRGYGSFDQAASISTISAREKNCEFADEEGKCCECGAVRGEEIPRKSLLHNWTDYELYSRVIAAESASIPEVCSRFCARESVQSGGKVKIAFLFMITTSLPFEPLWTKFFEGKEGLYSIYVHADPFDPNLFSSNQTSSSIFRDRLIPSQKADRGSPSLVLASNRLVANAMLDDPANGHFALLSGQCIPVRSFDHVYRAITASRKSFLEQIQNEGILWERYTGREGGEEVMLPEIVFTEFRKAAQWFVFLRRHALLILQDVQERKYWGKFDRKCVIYFCGTDEHYYPTFLHIVDPGGVTGTSATYVQWPDYVSEHPVTFWWDDVNTDLIINIQSQADGQYLFARKFDGWTVKKLMDTSMRETILR